MFFKSKETPAARIARIEKQFPMPPGELKRLEGRRWILNHVPKGGVGAEIGVFRGHFSNLICQIAKPKKLYLIDPWTTIGATFGWGKEYTNFDTLTTEAAREQSRASVEQHGDVECVIIEDIYPRCASQIVEPLDFAYLDASHKYAPTLNELRHLDKQVKPGGLILGDDWAPDPANQHHGVFVAVQEFVAATDWEIIAAGPAAQWALRRKLKA